MKSDWNIRWTFSQQLNSGKLTSTVPVQVVTDTSNVRRHLFHSRVYIFGMAHWNPALSVFLRVWIRLLKRLVSNFKTLSNYKTFWQLFLTVSICKGQAWDLKKNSQSLGSDTNVRCAADPDLHHWNRDLRTKKPHSVNSYKNHTVFTSTKKIPNRSWFCRPKRNGYPETYLWARSRAWEPSPSPPPSRHPPPSSSCVSATGTWRSWRACSAPFSLFV